VGNTPPVIFSGDAANFGMPEPCFSAMWRILYIGQPGSLSMQPGAGTPTAEGLLWAQQAFDGMFAKYISYGGTLFQSEATQGSLTDLNAQIFKICTQTPAICENSLKAYCEQITLDDIIRDPSIQPWCGCYMPDAQYAKYTDLYEIALECTPACNATGVILPPTSDGTGSKVCQSSTCVIDDISIELYSSRVEGTGINFTQLCPSCSSGATCTCLITGSTINIINSTIPTLSIGQNCGTASQCLKATTDSSGRPITVSIPCSSGMGYDPYAILRAQNQANLVAAVSARNLRILAIFVAVILIIGLVFVTAYLNSASGTSLNGIN
jgi:hypothetical protein